MKKTWPPADAVFWELRIGALRTRCVPKNGLIFVVEFLQPNGRWAPLSIRGHNPMLLLKKLAKHEMVREHLLGELLELAQRL
jgi:hypothetical protein